MTYAEDWVTRYKQKNYVAIDPVLRSGFHSIMPLDWQKLDRSGAKLRRFFGEAEEFRVGRQGLTFPIRGRFGEAALLTVTSDDADVPWQSTLRLYLRDFQVLAYHLHQTILRIEGVHFAPIALSPRESECLKWISRGKTVAETAIILSISDRTVRFYLDTARHKLNATNITHAVAIAIHHNILTM